MMALKVKNVDTCWNSVEIQFIINLDEIFFKHQANEKLYKRKLKAYKGTFLNFNVYSPPQTLDYRAMNIISLIHFWFYNFEIWIFWLFIFVKVFNYHFVAWIIVINILK